MSHQLNKQEAFQQWTRQMLMQHETALRNLQDWFFAVCIEAKIKPEDLAKAIHNSGPLYGFGQNFQLRMREETERRMKEEKEKLAKPTEEVAAEMKQKLRDTGVI